MSNIVEQQNLLKGLPDTRLATLMQNPVATIPPFLVAAEAQRRQAIRQQFAGSGDNESVVDSLTRQLASVPQNIQATPQPMPQIPQTPPMMGVAALQQAQQGMANGGPVRRFAEQGYVAPQFRGRSGAGAYAEPTESVLSRVYNYVTPGITTLLTNMQTMGLSNNPARQQLDLQNNIEEAASTTPNPEDKYRTDRAPTDLSPKPTIPPNPNTGKAGTSTENQTAAEDENRRKLEALLAYEGPSDMEKAQKWFAMASQFYDPKLTTGQSIARAGLAFTEAAGTQAQAEREARQAQAEALLKYDINEQERQRAAAAAERERTSLSAKDTATVFAGRLNAMDDMISQAKKSLDTMRADPMVSPENISAAEKQITDLMKARDAVAGQLSSLVEQSYGPIKFDTFSFSTGFQR